MHQWENWELNVSHLQSSYKEDLSEGFQSGNLAELVPPEGLLEHGGGACIGWAGEQSWGPSMSMPSSAMTLFGIFDGQHISDDANSAPATARARSGRIRAGGPSPRDEQVDPTGSATDSARHPSALPEVIAKVKGGSPEVRGRGGGVRRPVASRAPVWQSSALRTPTTSRRCSSMHTVGSLFSSFIHGSCGGVCAARVVCGAGGRSAGDR